MWIVCFFLVYFWLPTAAFRAAPHNKLCAVFFGGPDLRFGFFLVTAHWGAVFVRFRAFLVTYLHICFLDRVMSLTAELP
jgi:hypothetical protein